MDVAIVKMGSMDMAAKLRVLVAELGLNQARLARAVGVSKSSVSNWLAGGNVPDAITALRLARELGVSLDYLADDEQDAPPSGPGDAERLLLVYARQLEGGPAEALRRLINFPVTYPPGTKVPIDLEFKGNKPGRESRGQGA